MTIRPLLIAAGTLLAVTAHTTAEPGHDHPFEPPVEARIEHLENAARHLAEAGMTDESTRLRVQAAALRRDHRQGQIADLEAMIEALRNDNRILRERIAELEAKAHTRTATPEAPADLDHLAAEAHRKQTEETWAAIKRAARGARPLPAAPPDQALPLEPPRPLPPGVKEGETPAVRDEKPPRDEPDDRDLLKEILRTLQRIESRV
jgi:hypothetical protein